MGAEARRSTRATPSRAESSSRRALWYISDSVAPPPEYSIAAALGVVGIKRKERGVSTFFSFPPLLICFSQNEVAMLRWDPSGAATWTVTLDGR